jgi:hypothetical protein
LASGAYPVISSAAIGNTEYDLSFTLTNDSGGSYEDHYLMSVTVSWDDARGEASSVALTSKLVWNDPDESLDNSDQAGTGKNSKVGDITRPTGAAVAIARTKVDINNNDKAVGDWVHLGDSDPTRENQYGIKINDCAATDASCQEEAISVIELIDTDSPIFKVSGDIYQDGVAIPFVDLNASPNVLTSEGGGCAIYEISGQISYTCLFGEGWYGTITLFVPEGNGNKPEGEVCLSPREYKYYGIDPSTVSGAIQSTDIVGQSGLVRFTTDAGVGPYLATSNAAPGLGYYYMYSEVDKSTEVTKTSITNTAGNINNQHFLIVTYKASEDTQTRCVTGTSAPLVSANDVVGYPSLTNSSYTDGTNTIPHDEIIMGYVNTAFEISGEIDVSALTASAGALTADIEVGINPLPAFAQLCELDVVAEQILGYSCFVDYNWGGTVTPAVVSGSVHSIDFAPLSYDFSGPGVGKEPPVTADVTGKNFTATPGTP